MVERVRTRPSFVSADVGPTADERVAYATEGAKIVPDLRDRLDRYRRGTLELWNVV